MKGDIIKTLFRLKNLGHPESTIKTTSDKLLYLAKNSDLDDPEFVKTFIARLNGENSYKATLVKAYNHYVRTNGLTWEKPKYKYERKIPKIPTKEAINQIIARASKKYAMVFTLLVETGAMPFELQNVTLRDIDSHRRTLTITGSKGHASRVHKLKPNTIAMLREYLSKHEGNRPFPKSTAMSKRWRKFRNIVADSLAKSELRQIRLYDLRHFYATMTYHKTKDILYVKQQMGHKKIETTLIYTQLVDFNDEEFHCRTARTVEEASKLIEAGFEYITEINGAKLFRKRK